MKLSRIFPSLFFVPFFFSPCFSQSNEGTEFWFSFMEHRDVRNNTMVAMITSKYATEGEIRMPLQGWSQAFTLSPNQVELIELPSQAETIGSETVQRNGIQILTDEPASVYIHQYHSFRSEASIVLPVSSIGKEYFIMSYPGVQRQNITYRSEFVAIAHVDSTILQFRPSTTTRLGKFRNITYSVRLDAGETYQVQGQTALNDLTGTHIESNHDFSLFAGTSWTEVPIGCGARDNLLEQMYPLKTWGKQFVSVPNDRVLFDRFRILASENDTKIKVFMGNDTLSFTLNQGQFREYQTGLPSYIVSDKAISVAQFNVGNNCSGHSVGDPSMVLLNSVEQTRDTVTLFNSSFEQITENYINIITQTFVRDQVQFDGAPISNFDEVPANPLFSFARLRVSAGTHTITSQGCGVIATAYGYGNVESYSYAGGASFRAINANPIPDGGCLDDPLGFDSGLPEGRYSFDWDLGDGGRSERSTFSHTYTALGEYPVRLIVNDNCLRQADTIYQTLKVSLREPIEVSPDTLLCEGDTLRLWGRDRRAATYEWTGPGPSDFESDMQFPIIPTTTVDMSGTYEVISNVTGCKSFPATTEINIVPNPQPDLGIDSIICPDQRPDIVLFPGDFIAYLWHDQSSFPQLRIREEGTYYVEVTDENSCTTTDSITFERRCPVILTIPNVFSPNEDRINDVFKLIQQNILDMQLTIFDRWGVTYFSSTNPEGSWDGKIRGKDAPEGVYFYVLTYSGYAESGEIVEETRRGNISLFR